MKRWITVIFILSLGVLGLSNIAQADRDAQRPNDPDNVDPVQVEPGPIFATLDITIDPKGQPLGAFQIEMTSPDTEFSVVGVESGGHAAFDHGRPPYFDPVVQQDKTDRLILAEYARPELKANELPTEAVRVVSVHVMLPAVQDGAAPEPLIQLELVTAGNAEVEKIDADVSYSFRTPERPE